MSHPFESLPTPPLGDELLDKAFSRAARAGRAKSGLDAQSSMLQTAANIISDNLENIVTAWPDIERLHPFYRDLADAIVGVSTLRQHLNEVGWAGRKATDIRSEYQQRLRGTDTDTARKHRKQAFARLADIVEEVEDHLAALMEARETLRVLPDIRPDRPTIVVAGYPNVGKSSFVNTVTRASNEEASYPFTTTQVHVGHVEHQHVKYQLVDTPGLLDRPPADRNAVESQAVSALAHAADAVLVVLDPSGTCGYPLETQERLCEDIEDRFDVPVLSVYNMLDRLDKTDRGTVAGERTMSVTAGTNVETVLNEAIEAVDYEPTLPVDDR
jgi:nucleolar GTP-binding protein